MTAGTVVAALAAWQPGLSALFQHAQPRIALALAADDTAVAITAPGWVYDGARSPDVVHRWSREDEQDRIYIQVEGAAYTVLVHTDGSRALAVAVPLHEALEHARAYMAEAWQGGPLYVTPAAPTPTALPPTTPTAPSRPAPVRRAVGVASDLTQGVTLPSGATLADEEATVLAILRDARAYKERYDAGTTRKTLPPTYAYLESTLGHLAANELQRLIRAYARLSEEQVRAAQGWYAMGASVLDTFQNLLAKKRTAG